MCVASWYFGSWDSIYFGILYSDSKLQRFKIIVKPDLSEASLHFIDMSEIISNGLTKSLQFYTFCDGFRICEDALVYFWNDPISITWRAYTGLISAPLTNVFTRWNASEQFTVMGLLLIN